MCEWKRNMINSNHLIRVRPGYWSDHKPVTVYDRAPNKEYIATCWTPLAQYEKVKIDNKWKGSNKPKETWTSTLQSFKFCINQNQSKLSRDSQQGGSVFVSGGFNVKKIPLESKKPQESCCAKRIAKKCTRKHSRPRTINQYVIRDQVLDTTVKLDTTLSHT